MYGEGKLTQPTLDWQNETETKTEKGREKVLT